MSETVDLAALRIEDFAAHLDGAFELQAGEAAVPLKLAKVDPAGNSGRPGGAFSVLLIAPQGPWLPQGVYPVAHPSLGVMEIFLVPIGPNSGGNGYQAVFA